MNAHIAFHFSIGMLLGTGIGLYWLARRLCERQPLHPGFLAWFVWSYGLGAFAVVPSLLRLLGVPESVCSSWIMNVFLCHPLIDKLRSGGMITGGSIIIAIAASQYLFMLMAIRSKKGGRTAPQK